MRVPFSVRGRAPDALSPGGGTLPAQVIVADTTRDNGGALGRRLHVDDFNGDNLSDVVIGTLDTFAEIEALRTFFGRRVQLKRRRRRPSVRLMLHTSAIQTRQFCIGLTSGDLTGDGVPEPRGGISRRFLGLGNAGGVHLRRC